MIGSVDEFGELVLRLWPNTADEKYEELLLQLQDDALATTRDGVSWEQVEALTRRVSRTVATRTVPHVAIHKGLSDLRHSERTRAAGGTVRHGTPEPEPESGPLLPWRRADMTLPEWIDADPDEAMDTLVATLGHDTARAISSLHATGQLLRSDVANAILIGEHLKAAARSKETD